jgi:hypothetical protein
MNVFVAKIKTAGRGTNLNLRKDSPADSDPIEVSPPHIIIARPAQLLS